MDWADDLLEWAAEGQIELPTGFCDEVDCYYQALLLGNEQFNLTRITDHRAFVVKHVMDALLGLAAMPTVNTGRHRVIDVGSGAGIPAVFLALANPRLAVTALDGTGKKMRWLEQVAAAAGWQNLKALHGRAEDVGRKKPYTGNFDLVTARAVGEAPALMRRCYRLLAPGGSMLLYKTPTQMEAEVEAVAEEAEKLGLSVRYSDHYELPDDAGLRAFWMIRRDA